METQFKLALESKTKKLKKKVKRLETENEFLVSQGHFSQDYNTQGGNGNLSQSQSRSRSMSRHNTGSIHEIEGVIGQVISEHNFMKKKNSHFEGKLNKIEKMIEALSNQKGSMISHPSQNRKPSISYTNKFNSISRKHFTLQSEEEGENHKNEDDHDDDHVDDDDMERSTVSDLTYNREQELMAKLFSNQKLRSQKSDIEESSYEEGEEGIENVNMRSNQVYESMGFDRVTEESDTMYNQYEDDDETLKQENIELEFDDEESDNFDAIENNRSDGVEDYSDMRSSEQIEEKYTSMLLEIERMKQEMETLNEENHNLENMISK